jgi:hypothetical protein
MATSNQGNKQSGGEGSSQGGGTKNRGFASMDPERQRQIASEGGKAAHQKGTAHEFTSEEARRAGSMSHGNRQSAESSSEGAARSATPAKSAAKPGAKQAASAGNKHSESGGSKQSEGSGSKSGGSSKSR